MPDPNHVPETLVTGPCTVAITSNPPFFVLTCTAVRPNIDQLLAGNQKPDQTAVVVARLAMSLEIAAQIAKLLSTTLANLKPAAGTA
jgi:hypothetical protein